MKMKLLTPVLAAIVAGTLSVLAANTSFFTSIGDQVFPFTAPTTNPSAAGTIDNMIVGATTPRAGTFTTLSSASQACTADPCNTTGLAGAQGGAIGQVGGTSSTTGNAGGASNVTGGTPGATGVGGAANITGAAGGATSGTGGAVNITAGAGTAGNANGGSVVVTPGAKNGSGAAGAIRLEANPFILQATPTAKTVSATLTAAELTAGIITINQGAAGASALQLPAGSALQAVMPGDIAVGDSFDISVINISTVAAESASLTTNSGWTLVGDMDIAANSAATTKSAGRFRIRWTATNTFTIYRLS